MKILILGCSGMLGHMNYTYLKSEGYDVQCNKFRYPSEDFKKEILNFTGDAIINCIGAIPQKTNEFYVNSDLPVWLDINSNCLVIHPATDFQNYGEDEYSKSKKISFDYLMNNSNKSKIIQCSIIGPEINSKKCFLEWFLNCENEVSGYTKAIWNGVTTLEWAKRCLQLIKNNISYPINTILYSEPISKFELMIIIKKIFNKSITIIPVEKGFDRTLVGNLKVSKIKNQLIELHKFINKN